MIYFSVSNDVYFNDLMELVRPFGQAFSGNFNLNVDYKTEDGEIKIIVTSNFFDNFVKIYRFNIAAENETERKRVEKRYLKIAIYRTLSFLTKINLPYGCLTGIRPTKMFVEIENERDKYGKSARGVFTEDYSVSSGKVDLIEKIVSVQKPLRNTSDNAVDVFVFIPFCPSRCAYCSFVSQPIEKQKKILEPYAECLRRELEYTKKLVQERKYKVRSVYVGGGTPTSLPLDLLDKILDECHFKTKEFTVEAGRPDTLTPEVVKLLKKHKVTRVSVNPQTFNDETLVRIGRAHTSADVEAAYKLVKGMFIVNMDLIATLPGESFEDFKRSVDKTVSLNPENVTVHTLYIKKGSDLQLGGGVQKDAQSSVEAAALATQMVEYAYKKLSKNGYVPYYMYRQKYTSGNLENVGYAKPGCESIYNIDIMEEDTSIIANGANGISKKLTRNINLIEREANYKEPLEYVKHFDTVLERKEKFWQTEI